MSNAPMIWLEPWSSITDLDWDAAKKLDYCQAWEGQLRREVGPQHALFGRQVSLIARRFDTDDALFQLSGQHVAEVHLTWRRGMEPDPRWPRAGIFDSLEVWGRDSMIPQHEDWSLDR